MVKTHLEVIGLIGAGKSTACRGFSDNQAEDQPKVHVLVEEEELLHEYVVPILEDVYRSDAGTYRNKEYAIEVVFAIFRLIHLKMMILGREVFSKNLGEYVDRLMEIFAFAQYVDEQTVMSLKEKTMKLGRDFTRTDINYYITDRGVADILCFILERLSELPPKSEEALIFQGLFIEVYKEICRAIYAWNDERKMPISKQDFFYLLPGGVSYRVMLFPSHWSIANQRVNKRGRACEVDEKTGAVLDRVKKVNSILHKVYSDLFDLDDSRLPSPLDGIQFQKAVYAGLGLVTTTPENACQLMRLEDVLIRLWTLFEKIKISP